MTTAAIIMMVTTMSLVTGFTLWFFVRILEAPHPDSRRRDEGGHSPTVD